MTEQATSEVAQALDALLRDDPEAIVAALTPDSVLINVPDSITLYGHAGFGGRSGLDLVVNEDQLVLVDAWHKAQVEVIVSAEAHLLGEPDQLATVSFFDLRREHGVHVLVLHHGDPKVIDRSLEVRESIRRRTAHVKKDGTAVFVEIDEATTAMLGWVPDEMVGHSSTEFVHPDDIDRALQDWIALRNGQAVGPLRLRFRHARGHYVWVEIANQNCLEDPTLGCVLADMIDISAEMAQLEALRERERMLARLAEALPIGICHLRPDREVVYANDSLTALVGPFGTVAALLERVAESDRPRVEMGIANALRGRSGSIEIGIDDEHVDHRRCELTFRPLLSDDVAIDGVILCAADVTDRSRLRAELEHRATHDALTGCLNRAAMVVALERALHDSPHVAVAFVDLDQFKVVNDELGHAAGDELLRVAAARLRRVIRDGDQLARLGGDEFVVICSADDAAFDDADLAQRLSVAINGDVVFAKQRIRLCASVGVAVATPGELDAEALVHRADTAMYKRKKHDLRA